MNQQQLVHYIMVMPEVASVIFINDHGMAAGPCVRAVLCWRLWTTRWPSPASLSIVRLMAAPGLCQIRYTKEQNRYLLMMLMSSKLKCLCFLTVLVRAACRDSVAKKAITSPSLCWSLAVLSTRILFAWKAGFYFANECFHCLCYTNWTREEMFWTRTLGDCHCWLLQSLINYMMLLYLHLIQVQKVLHTISCFCLYSTHLLLSC